MNGIDHFFFADFFSFIVCNYLQDPSTIFVDTGSNIVKILIFYREKDKSFKFRYVSFQNTNYVDLFQCRFISQIKVSRIVPF